MPRPAIFGGELRKHAVIGHYPERVHRLVYAAGKRGEGPRAADPHQAVAVGWQRPFLFGMQPDGSRRHLGVFRGARAGTEVGPEAPMGAWFGPMLEEIRKLDDVLDLSAAAPERRGEYESVPKQVWSSWSLQADGLGDARPLPRRREVPPPHAPVPGRLFGDEPGKDAHGASPRSP